MRLVKQHVVRQNQQSDWFKDGHFNTNRLIGIRLTDWLINWLVCACMHVWIEGRKWRRAVCVCVFAGKGSVDDERTVLRYKVINNEISNQTTNQPTGWQTDWLNDRQRTPSNNFNKNCAESSCIESVRVELKEHLKLFFIRFRFALAADGRVCATDCGWMIIADD